MVMILSPPRNIFVRRTIQTLGGFLARFLNTNNQPRLSQKKILKNSRRLNICHRCNSSFWAFITSSIIFHLQLCYGYQILPRRFLKLRNDLPPCVSCLFGKAHCRPWRHKFSTTSTGGVLRSADITKPGQRVDTDQIVSAQPGLVPQEKGQITRACIWGATVFVDYASRWVKVHLMQDATGDSTLEAKNAFEGDCMTRNVVPQH